MASKFMINSAFKARLLLRPSHQRTVLFVTVYKPLVLSSRTYSESVPKDSESVQRLQSSRHENEDKDQSSKAKHQIPSLWATIGIGIGVTGSIITLIVYVTRQLWLEGHTEGRRVQHESARESAIYEKLKKGPEFREAIIAPIPRNSIVEEVRTLITPTEENRSYHLIVGEHGTGKTSLIKLAVNSMDKDKPKGIVYINLPILCGSEIDIAQAMQKALAWSSDPVIDSDKPVPVRSLLEFFSRAAVKYQQEHKKVPVMIIDNANRLAQNQQEFLDVLQDYAKHAADEGIATVVFVSSEGVPRRMMERGAWSRNESIIEIGDVSKEEALQYLKLRKINEEQAAQIYELVGGRMIHLQKIAAAIKRNTTLQDIRQKMFSKTESELQAAEVYPDYRYHEHGATIIRELLKKGSISLKTYNSLVGVDTGKKLLETNVFAFHVNSKEISFQSRLMKRFCEENAAFWEVK